jgi:hypothetical protein
MNNVVVSGYPRSGNTFLNCSIALMYGIEEPKYNHTVKALEHFEKMLTPYRNPVDCISSWSYLQQTNLKSNDQVLPETIDSDINYYIRFGEKSLEVKKKITFLDFDIFTKDLAYIEEAVAKTFSLKKVRTVSLDEVKEYMLTTSRSNNLPQNNKVALDNLKSKVSLNPTIDRCFEIYQEIHAHSG